VRDDDHSEHDSTPDSSTTSDTDHDDDDEEEFCDTSDISHLPSVGCHTYVCIFII